MASQVDFIAVPVMTTVLNPHQTFYARWTWHSLVTTRAKENVVPIICADHPEREYANGVYTSGASCIADPTHRFNNEEGPYSQALKLMEPRKEGFIITQITKESIYQYRMYRRDVGLLE